jgi:CrcB protein
MNFNYIILYALYHIKIICKHLFYSIMSILLKILLVGGGGAIGALIRYALESCLKTVFATWVINTVGSFLMGLFFGWLLVAPWSSGRKDMFYLLFMCGFCGGFSTFAHYSLICVNYFKDGNVVAGIGYMVTTVLAGLICCIVGIYVGSRM